MDPRRRGGSQPAEAGMWRRDEATLETAATCRGCESMAAWTNEKVSRGEGRNKAGHGGDSGFRSAAA